ncbi:MAG: hypothetical protein HOF23_03940 [Rhodospirillaceae bacterium]|nr:hypothetical protein [Rhodospirillaceae bacterium]
MSIYQTVWLVSRRGGLGIRPLTSGWSHLISDVCVTVKPKKIKLIV